MKSIYITLMAILFTAKLYAIAPIVGPPVVCLGSTATLTDATGGGTWTSSNTTVAPIILALGTLTGASVGTTVITYTVGSSYVTTVITVGQSPTTITGTGPVCVGSAITVTDLISGGSWTATSGVSITLGGVVTGVTVGTSMITYMLTDGCFATHLVTVDPLPASITGPDELCTGSSIGLSDLTGGGTWSSSMTAIATVGTGGVVSGVTTGTATITYKLTIDGCAAEYNVTVIPSPAAITGITTFCAGAGTTLSDVVGGGFWTSSITSVATVGSSTGVVSGVSTGTTVISYNTACGVVTTVVAVNPLPYVWAITGGGAFCAGGAGYHIGTSGTSSGISYELYDGTTLVSTLVGTGGTLDFGSYSTAGTYHIVAINSGTGCSSTLSGTATITVNPLPAVYTVTGGGPYCSGGLGSTIGLSASSTGINYSLMDGITVVSTLSGTGGTLNFGYETVAATYSVIGTNAITSCTNTMTGSATVSINPLPTISATNTAATCGNTDTLTAGGGASYSWAPTTGLSCPICATAYIAPTATTVYTATGTDTNGCINTATVTMDANSISGFITPAVTGTIKVWLIQFNTSDSSITALDSTYACVSDGTPYYEFMDPAAGNYMVKAFLLGGTVGASGYIPTYGLSAPHWDSASTVSHAGAADTMHINMIYGTVPSGPGFISGYVYSGAGRGTSTVIPAVNMLVYLENTDGTILTYTYTDATGAYSFGSLGYGNYLVSPETYNYYTTTSDIINLNTTADTAVAVNFKQHTSYGTITPYNDTRVPVVAANGSIVLFPNPAQNEITIKGLTETSTYRLLSLAGQNITNGALQTGSNTVSLKGIPDGMYLLELTGISGSRIQFKVVKE